MSSEQNTYLTFKVKDHTFGITVDKVLEIKEYETPKPMPESPKYMQGVTEFRDQVVPLIDCGLKFNLPPIDINPLTCIVVLELRNELLDKDFKVGIVVDAVSDVFETGETEVVDLEDDYRPGYITSTYKSENGLVVILDANKVFSEKDIISIDRVVSKLDS